MNIITVDAGKYQTNALIGTNGVRFRTKVEEVENNFSLSNNGYYIEWDGRMYLIGDGARYIDYDTTKHKLQHKLAVYTACGKLLKQSGSANLVVLSPLSMYSNKQVREEYRQFILNDGKASFELDNENIQLVINDVVIFGETCGIPFANPTMFKNKTVGILDIGGLNVNGLIVKNMAPIKGTEFTINAGSLILMEKIRKALNKEIKGANIQEYQMDSILKQGFYLGEGNYSKEVIQAILAEHFKEILQTTKANNWDIKGLDVVATGGGSLDITLENIKEHIPQATLSSNPVWDNCIGGNKVGEILYGR